MANILVNPSFEANVNGWSATTASTTVARVTTDFQVGTACAQWTRTAASGNMTLTVFPFTSHVAAEAEVYSAGAYVKTAVGTNRVVRLDIRFYNSSSVDIGGLNGTSTQITASSAWQQVKLENVAAPAGTSYVITKLVAISTATSDSILVDACQLELGATLPAYNESDTPLDTPVVTVTSTTVPTVANNDGEIQVSWPAVTDAASYEAGIATGHDQTAGFVTTSAVTSPHTFTGLAAGDYTVAIRAIPAA